MLMLFVCFTVTTAGAADVNYMSAAQLKGLMNKKAPMLVADIQKANKFKKHHFYASVETDAYPVKKEMDKMKLDVVVQLFQQAEKDVILVGPRGGPAAKRAAAYLVEKGVPADKVFILDGGVKSWPDPEMLLDVACGCG